MNSQKPRVQIKVTCKNLPPKLCHTYASIGIISGGYIHDKDTINTEVILDNLNPCYETTLTTDYLFEERQLVKVQIFYCEEENQKQQGLLIGSTEGSIGRVIHSGGELSKTLDLADGVVGDKETSVTIKVWEDPASKDNIVLKLQGYGLDKKDLFGKSDPYIVVERKTDRGRYLRSYRSEIIKNTLNPDWKPIVVSLDRLCSGDLNCGLYFRCYDWDGAKGDPEDKDTEFDDLIGEFPTTARQILESDGEDMKFELINPRKKRKKKGYSHSGLITLKCYRSSTDYTFLDYMFGGTNLNFTVAIDLTSSNGDVRQPTSLHFMDPYTPNEYAIAIQAVLEIIQEYDSDELFPAFGFGARVPPAFKLCHEYPLTGDFSNPFCKGVDGVMLAYQKTLQEIKLSGPTYFAPVIKNVSNLARDYQDGSHYFVLLILTDGTVDDWVDTKKSVIEASHLPVSIIVVGIGGGRFSEMEILDQDFGLLKVGQEQAVRDSVQFVQMRRFLRLAADGTGDVRWSKVALGKEVLAELPHQVVDYMRRRSLAPRTVPPASISTLIQSIDPPSPPSGQSTSTYNSNSANTSCDVHQQKDGSSSGGATGNNNTSIDSAQLPPSSPHNSSSPPANHSTSWPPPSTSHHYSSHQESTTAADFR